MTFAPISETILGKTWRGPARKIYISLRVENVLNELLPQLLPLVADKVRMLAYREGKLTLLTPSPAVSQEVFSKSAVLMKMLNEALRGRVVEEIGFKLSPEASPALPHEGRRYLRANGREPGLAPN